MTDLDGLKIPVATRQIAETVIVLTDAVCEELLDEEYARLARQVVAKLARKRPSPLLSGRAPSWAGATLYALGQVNFLFDDSTEPYVSHAVLSGAFRLSTRTLSQKAKQIRDMLRMDHVSAEFLRADVVDLNPLTWYVEIDGLPTDARDIPLPLQIQAFESGFLPYVPALGRDGTTRLASGRAESDLPYLLMRSSVLKQLLVKYAQEPRFAQELEPMLAAAGTLEDSTVVDVLDTFIMRYRFPDGSMVIDSFLESRDELDLRDRDMLLRWRDPVDGIFEVLRIDGEASVLLNLIDDMVYRVYTNTGQTVLDMGDGIAFISGRVVPLEGESWVASGVLRTYPDVMGPDLARAAMEMVADLPALAFRNPDIRRRGWEQMGKERARFIDAFGTDELILPPVQAQARLRTFLGDAQPLAFPADLLDEQTIGIIYDSDDGLMLLPGYGKLCELFENPELAASPAHTKALLQVLESQSMKPAPLRRLAASHPDNADAVYAAVLDRPSFSWAEHGEDLLREYKPWYFEGDRSPGILALGERLLQLFGEV